jgi:putative addiction module component (TIGR02574 family)
MERARKVNFEGLSVAERILYVQDLWDRIAGEPEQVPVTPEQREELDRRLEEHAASPEAARPWTEVVSRVRGGR